MRRLLLVPVIILLLSALLLAVRASGVPAVHAEPPLQEENQEIVLDANNLTYTGPMQATAGPTRFRLVPAGGPAPFGVQVARLQEGMTMDDLNTALATGDFAEIDKVVAGTVLLAGSPTTFALDLQEGQYVLGVEGPEGQPMLIPGMDNPIEVVAAEGGAQELPPADGTVELLDFAFDFPEPLQGGEQTWNIENVGEQPHEIVLLQLAPGATLDDFMAAMGPDAPEGPPPGEVVGGVIDLQAGESTLWNLNLEPADYVAVCFFEDPATGKPHVELGMIQNFTIAAGGAPAAMPVSGAALAWPTLSILIALAGLIILGAAWYLRRRAANA